MSAELQERYLSLKNRHEALLRKKIGLEAQKEERDRHRTVLIEALQKAGVNVDDLPAEQARLEGEIAASLAEFENQVTAAEAAFSNKSGG